MKLTIKILLTALLKTIIVAELIEKPLGPFFCPLKWVPIATDSSLPKESLAVQVGKHYVGSSGQSTALLGRIESSNDIIGVGYFPTSPNITETQTFKILTNPSGCQTNWVEKQNTQVSEFAFKFNGNLIGRVADNSNLLPGFATSINTPLTYVDSDYEVSDSSEYFVLISYSIGLKLKISDFIFHNEVSPGTDFVGLDEIHNAADVEISQTVTHSKSVTETFSFTESESKTTSWSVSVDVEVELGVEGVGAGVGVGVEYSESYTSGWEKEISTSKTRDVTVSRTVSVPPRLAVQICSTIKTAENFTIAYSATGRYTAPGLTGIDIVEIIKQYFPQAYAHGSAAVIDVEGDFSGALYMNTQFIVHPINAPRGCDQIREEVVQHRKKLNSEKRNKNIMNH